MLFDFTTKVDNKDKLISYAKEHSVHSGAYCELIVYLKSLFTHYNDLISKAQLNAFVKKTDWGWCSFFNNIDPNDKITFITYNYDIWLERLLDAYKLNYNVCGFKDRGANINIVKPHGSIDFIPMNIRSTSTGIDYNIGHYVDNSTPIKKIKRYPRKFPEFCRSTLIPPAGDSTRVHPSQSWSDVLRNKARSSASDISANDEVVICGISYWYVDRKEIDEILINIDPKVNITLINPNPSSEMNAILCSFFEKYVLQTTSERIGDIIYA